MPETIHPDLAPYRLRPAAPAALAGAMIALGAVVAAMPQLLGPASLWTPAGIGVAIAGAYSLLILGIRVRRHRLWLEKATRLLEEETAVPMRLRVSRTRAGTHADLTVVKRGTQELLAGWVDTPGTGALPGEDEAHKPTKRVLVFPPPPGFPAVAVDTLQAEVRSDALDPYLVVIQTRGGTLLSRPDGRKSVDAAHFS